MSDDLLATILILVSAVIHAGMSALIKTSEDKYARRASMLMVSG